MLFGTAGSAQRWATPSRGPMVLAVRLAHRGQPLRPLAYEMQTAPQPIARGTPGSGIRRGLGQHAAPSGHGHRLGVETVMLGLAPMDRLHGLGVP
jgi:hypothetical protein